MQWKTRSRQGRVAAGRTVPRRARRPPRPFRRAATSHAGARMRAVRSPLPVPHGARATSELHKQTTRTPSAGRLCLMAGIGRSGGTLSPGRPILLPCRPEAAGAGGPKRQAPRPQEQGRRTCGTERVISPAPLPPGAMRGVPARRGSRRRELAPAQGKAFPARKVRT